MQICSLASGSKGNCLFVDMGRDAIIIDCGITYADLLEKTAEAGVDLNKVRGIFVTHEHIDHIKGVGMLSKKMKLPVHCNAETATVMLKRIGDVHELCCDIEKEIDFAGVGIRGFRLPHDASFTVGYRLFDGKKTFAMATDLGLVTEGVKKNLMGADMVLLESNHDIEMLRGGRYPYILKRRILSDNGHLSNDACANTLAELVKGGTEKVLLGHLSQDNNNPEIAFNTVSAVLANNGIVEGRDATVDVAVQCKPSAIITI